MHQGLFRNETMVAAIAIWPQRNRAGSASPLDFLSDLLVVYCLSPSPSHSLISEFGAPSCLPTGNTAATVSRGKKEIGVGTWFKVNTATRLPRSLRSAIPSTPLPTGPLAATPHRRTAAAARRGGAHPRARPSS